MSLGAMLDREVLGLFGGNTLRIFRRDPEVPGAWLYKEGPFGAVWRLHGTTSVAGEEIGLTAHPLRYLLEGGWFGPGVWLFVVVQRRRWLKRHAVRVRRALWRQAAPLV